MGQEGPAHSPTFTSVVLVEGRRVGRGSGSSKKESESQAALAALRELGHDPLDVAAEDLAAGEAGGR